MDNQIGKLEGHHSASSLSNLAIRQVWSKKLGRPLLKGWPLVFLAPSIVAYGMDNGSFFRNIFADKVNSFIEALLVYFYGIYLP